MAAYFKILDCPRDVIWHVGQPFNYDPEDVIDVQIDGHEMFNITFPQRVFTLTGYAAIFYAAYCKETYKNAKNPIITEEGINNLLSGNKKKNLN